jgi:multidrug resistance efflux pump
MNEFREWMAVGISVASCVIALVALVRAWLADRRASIAEAKANEARKSVADALRRIADLEELKSAPRWEVRNSDKLHWLLRNVGSVPAFDVRIRPAAVGEKGWADFPEVQMARVDPGQDVLIRAQAHMGTVTRDVIIEYHLDDSDSPERIVRRTSLPKTSGRS